MITSLTQGVLLPMIAQEGGAEPGEGLTAIQTFTYFFAIPVASFIIISAIVWFATAPKREQKDVVNKIEDDENDNFITIIA
ncbi:MAG: hypothetical protein RL399_387 [Actinomycetota bacterium]|jgi:hypothetical protein